MKIITKRFNDAELAGLARLVAKALEVRTENVSLTEDDDGNFTIWVDSKSFTGTLEDVLKWASDFKHAKKPGVKP